MLNFDSKHAFIEGNLNKKKGKNLFKSIIIGGMIITNLLSFSGCAKDVPCDIQESHAHYYVNDDNIGRYIVSERSSLWGLNRLDDYILINEEEASLLKFLNKKDLFKIDDNKKAIDNIIDNQKDYKEYRYNYYYLMPMLYPQSDGKNTYFTYIYIPTIGYSWTDDPHRTDLTGEERVCHYVYYGYRVIKNDKGVYELERSQPVDSIEELPEGYDYIKEIFYDIVDLYNRNEILDYEDGTEEGKKIISYDEFRQAQSRSR